jgi:hypothetical protein
MWARYGFIEQWAQIRQITTSLAMGNGMADKDGLDGDSRTVRGQAGISVGHDDVVVVLLAI